MKFNLIPAIIAVLLSAIVAYAFYSWSEDDMCLLNCVCSAVWSITTLGAALALTYSKPRLSVNIKVLASVFFFILLIANIILAVSSAGTPTCIIVEGGLLLVFLLIAYLINNR